MMGLKKIVSSKCRGVAMGGDRLHSMTKHQAGRAKSSQRGAMRDGERLGRRSATIVKAMGGRFDAVEYLR